jgi:hypothetical protein
MPNRDPQLNSTRLASPRTNTCNSGGGPALQDARAGARDREQGGAVQQPLGDVPVLLPPLLQGGQGRRLAADAPRAGGAAGWGSQGACALCIGLRAGWLGWVGGEWGGKGKACWLPWAGVAVRWLAPGGFTIHDPQNTGGVAVRDQLSGQLHVAVPLQGRAHRGGCE